MTLREIRFQVVENGRRTETIAVATTLLDSARHLRRGSGAWEAAASYQFRSNMRDVVGFVVESIVGPIRRFEHSHPFGADRLAYNPEPPRTT